MFDEIVEKLAIKCGIVNIPNESLVMFVDLILESKQAEIAQLEDKLYMAGIQNSLYKEALHT